MGSLKEEYGDCGDLGDYGVENQATGKSSMDGGKTMNLSQKDKTTGPNKDMMMSEKKKM